MGIIIECVMLAYVRCISNNEQYDKGPYVSVVGGAAVCKQFVPVLPDVRQKHKGTSTSATLLYKCHVDGVFGEDTTHTSIII